MGFRINFVIVFSFLISIGLHAETMDVNINNPRIEGNYFKYDLQIKRTDEWITGFGEIGGLGNSDFFFNYNEFGFTGSPAISDTNLNITSHPNDYELVIQITGQQLHVKLTFIPVSFVWQPALDIYEDLCTVELEIGNPAESSGVTWDQINSGFTDGDGEPITPTYFGSGDIPLDPTDIKDIESTLEIPRSFKLYQNYPNPFNPETTIRFDIPVSLENVEIIIYNNIGMQVRTLFIGSLNPSRYVIHWDGRNNHNQQLATGVYFLQLQSKFFIATRKIVLLR